MRRLIILSLALLARAAVAASHADLSVNLPLPARLTAAQPTVTGYVQNNGPDAAENVTVVATTSNGQQFEVPLGTLSPRDSKGFTLTFPSTDAEFRLDAGVRSTTPDPDGSNDTTYGRVQVTSAPQLVFSLVTQAPADPGQPVTYGAYFGNNGAFDASHLTFSVPLDDDWTFGASLTPGLHCSATAQAVSCTVDALAAGAPFTAFFTLVAPNHPDGEPLRTTAVTFTTDKGVFQPPGGFLARSIFRHVAVTNTADDGGGSLRQAIVSANATPQGISCKIVFDIPLGDGERVATIRPLTPLPALTAPTLYIDGSTQRAAHGDTNPDGPEIEINGSSLQTGNGLETDNGSATSNAYRELRELVVNGFPGNGINFGSGQSNVIGCYVGTDPTGRHAVPNGGRGVVVSGPASIRDNVISGNGRSGIFVPSGANINITNNRIGVAAGSEFLPLGNGASGIYIGPRSAESSISLNVIAFNRDAGIGIDHDVEDIVVSANANASNGGLPIDYGLDGVTVTGSPGFEDPPPFPILTTARLDGAAGKTIVEGRVDVGFVSSPNRVELFASESGEPRQSAQYLGGVSLASSNAKTFRFTYDGDLRGRFITATYTVPSSYYPEIIGSRTSEVSAAIGVEGEPTAPLRRLPHGADLNLQLGSSSGLRIGAGDTAVVSYLVSDQGPDEAHDVALTIDVAGAAAIRLNAVPAGTDCRLQGSSRIVCTQPRLAAGASFASSFVISAPLAKATIDLSATLTSSTDEVDRNNNSAELALVVTDAPNLSASVGFPGPVDPGGLAVYDFNVFNYGGLTVDDVTLTIPLPAGWEFRGASGDVWQCTPGAAAVACRVSALDARSSSAFQLTLRASTDPRGQGRSSNLVKISASQPLLYDPTIYIQTQVQGLIQVTSAADSGPGTLREAMTRANVQCPSQEQTCKIAFRLPPPVPPTGWYSIRPLTPLPAVTGSVLIDGRTQSDATGDTNPLGPEVELDGSQTATGNGIYLHSGWTSGVRGLAINHFPENGVLLDALAIYASAVRTIADCYIGTDATGRTAAPNGLRGIRVQVTPGYSTIASIIGNVISGNTRSGVFVDSGAELQITGNRIGVAAGDELAPLGNGASGVYLGSSELSVVDENIVAFNGAVGIGSDLSARFIGLQRNVLRGNGQQGIDYGLDGVTTQDGAAGDASKYFPPLPLLTGATWDAASGVTRVEGIAPASIFSSDRGIIDVYRSSAAGSADEWLGQTIVEPSDQPRPFAFTVGKNLQGSLAVATFTRGVSSTRWTSELSAPVPVTP